MKYPEKSVPGLVLTILSLALAPALSRADADFSMPVMDVFTITGKGLVATGRIESGSVTDGEVVCLERQAGGGRREVTVGGIEQFMKILESASAGENVGLLLTGLEKGDVTRGDRVIGTC